MHAHVKTGGGVVKRVGSGRRGRGPFAIRGVVLLALEVEKIAEKKAV